MKAKRETVAAVIAAGVLLGGGGAAAAGIVGASPEPGPSAPGHAQRPAAGRVAGKFERVGGPVQPGTLQSPVVPLSGTMRFARAGHDPISARVGRNGVFSVLLGPGVYHVSGQTPDITGEPGNVPATCSLSGAVTVTGGAISHVTVVCSVP